jgi:hypothetical protein
MLAESLCHFTCLFTDLLVSFFPPKAPSCAVQSLKVLEFNDTLAVGALAPGLQAAPALKELQLYQLQPAGVIAVAHALGRRSAAASLKSLALSGCR